MCVAARTCRSSSCTLKDRTGLDRYSMLDKLRADLILVVEDVRETSDGIERLLKADGYRVALANAP
jgi:hypothetical protein